MTTEDELLLESNFQAEKMDNEERNFYLNLLANSKEVQSSTRVADPSNLLGSLHPDYEPSSYINFIDEDEDIIPPFSKLVKSRVEESPEDKKHQKPFEIVTMALSKEKDKKGRDVILFNGAIASQTIKDDNKWINGRITKTGDRNYHIETHVMRYYEYLRNSEQMYTVVDDFVLFDEKTIRISRYLDNIKFERYCDALPPLTSELSQKYVDGLVMTMKLRYRG